MRLVALLLIAPATATAAPCPAPASGDTALHAAAVALAEGEACEIVPNLTKTMITSVAKGTPVQWTDSATWDPLTRRIRWSGREAGCTATGAPYVHMMFDDATSIWSIEPLTMLSPCGHAYEANALDPETGTYYFRRYGNDTAWQLANGSWSETPAVPGPSSSPAIALTYFPELQLPSMTAPGALVWVQTERLYVLPRGGSAWTTILLPSPIGDYHNAAEHDPVHGVMVLGGGNDAERLLYRFAADGTLTTLGPTPVDIGTQGQSGSYVTADPVSGGFVVYSFAGSTGAWWSFDALGDAWAPLTGPPQLSVNSFQVPIPEYGVIAMFDNRTPTMWVYRHEPSVPQPPLPPDAGPDGTGSDDEEPDREAPVGCGCASSMPDAHLIVVCALVCIRRQRAPTRRAGHQVT